MANILGSLFVELKANTAGFVEGMTGASYAAKKAGRDIQDALSGLSGIFSSSFSSLSPLVDSLGRLASVSGNVAIAGAGIAAAFVEIAARSADETSALYEQSQAAGVSVEALSDLEYVGKTVGVGSEAMATGLERMSKSALLATEGSKEQKEAFAELGVAVTRTDGSMRDTRDIFIDLADRFSKMPDGVEKTALAMVLLGRTGAQLIPVLNKGGAAIAELIDENEKLGNTTTKEMGKAAEEWEHTMTAMGAAGHGFVLMVEDSILPVMQAIADKIVWVGKAATGASAGYEALNQPTSESLRAGQRDISVVGAIPGEAETGNPGDLLAGNKSFSKNLASNQKFDLEAASASLLFYNKQMDETIKRNALAASANPWVQTDASLSKLTLDMSEYNSKFKEAQDINEKYLPAFEKYRQEQEALNNLVANYGLSQDAANKALQEYGVSIGAIAGDASKSVEKMSSSWKSFGDSVASDLGKLATSGKEFAKVLGDIVKGLGEMALKAALTGGGSGGSKSGFGGILGSVFGGGRAAGGSVDPGAMYMVGESGPELFSPQSPGSIIPNGGFGGHHVTYNVDARGAQPGVGPEVVSALKQAEDRAVFRSINALKQLNLRTQGGVFGT